MIRRTGTISLAAAITGASLLPVWTHAEGLPSKFRVTSIQYGQGGRLDDGILRQCDVARIVTDAIQDRKRGWKFRREKASGVPETIDLVLRIDRVVKLSGRPPPAPKAGGTELGISVLSAGATQMDQPFLCREEGLFATEASHCSRLESCGKKIAEQLSDWLSWKAR